MSSVSEARKRWEKAAAERLLRMAVYFQAQHKLRVNKSNPRPYLSSSKPGEYPRARTGYGRDHCLYEPTSVAGILADGLRVRVGFGQSAKYMLFLELSSRFRRKGLLDTLRDLRGQLKALALP